MKRDIDRRTPIRLTAKSPADLVGLAPYLLGFRPAESLVVVQLRAGRVVLTGRLDLDPDRVADDYVDCIRELAMRHLADGLVVLVYTDHTWGLELAVELAARLDDAGLLDALHVGADRWWSATCDGGCCPPEGTPYDLTSHPLSAAAVLAGMNVLPDRSVLAEWVRGPDPALLPVLEHAVRRARAEVDRLDSGRRARLIARLVADHLGGAAALDDAACTLLAVLVEDVQTRDVAWAAITRPHADQHVDLWRRVVARSPNAQASGPICLLGMAAWVAGNGALQNVCIDRMIDLDPTYSMTDILIDINEQSLSPEVWDGFGEELRRELRLTAAWSEGPSGRRQ